MIENYYNFINGFNEKEFIDSNDVSYDIKFYKCPKCGSYHVVRNGTYVRKTAINGNDSKITKIQKYICKKCKTSFKYLPLYLVTYSHFTSLTLCKILLNSSSFNKSSKIFNISRSTVRSIKKRFEVTVKEITFLINKFSILSFNELLKIYHEIFKRFLFCPSTDSTNYGHLINSLS